MPAGGSTITAKSACSGCAPRSLIMLLAQPPRSRSPMFGGAIFTPTRIHFVHYPAGLAVRDHRRHRYPRLAGGRPITNLAIMVIGTVLASFIQDHVACCSSARSSNRSDGGSGSGIIIFFIFLVCNIGGAWLAPIGDPLFIGFLRGVPFRWTFALMTPKPAGHDSVILLAVFLPGPALDEEGDERPARHGAEGRPGGGVVNIALLAGDNAVQSFSAAWSNWVRFRSAWVSSSTKPRARRRHAG